MYPFNKHLKNTYLSNGKRRMTRTCFLPSKSSQWERHENNYKHWPSIYKYRDHLRLPTGAGQDWTLKKPKQLLELSHRLKGGYSKQRFQQGPRHTGEKSCSIWIHSGKWIDGENAKEHRSGSSSGWWEKQTSNHEQPCRPSKTIYFELYTQLSVSYWKLLNLNSDLIRFYYVLF